jgi:hypothetical protein
VRKTAEDILFAEKKAVPSKIHYLLHASKEFPGTIPYSTAGFLYLPFIAIAVKVLVQLKNLFMLNGSPVPKIKDPVFAKTSQNARFLLSENERFGLVFVKTGSINSGTGQCLDDADTLQNRYSVTVFRKY